MSPSPAPIVAEVIPANPTLKGRLIIQQIELFVSTEAEIGGDCLAPERFRDVKSGSQVILRNSVGEIVAVSRLEPGRSRYALEGFPEQEEQSLRQTLDRANRGVPVFCSFDFVLQDIPQDLQIFQVEIPGAANGYQTYSRSDLEKADWQINLTIGV
ncbi:hypothetical protein [Egbenema bharatensis]|uniref:hypothetical protein n=1 Tax=Egbenema bharatensis TaxID=3463334 RepID=UPI003A87409B